MRALLTVAFRCLAFVFGLVILLDAALPTTDQAMHIDGHHDNRQPGRIRTTRYTVDLVGGNTGSCRVGYAAYNALHDGDAVTVTTSRLFKQCTRIVRGDADLYAAPAWRAWSLLWGVVAICVGLGWLRPGRNDDDD